MPFGIFILIRVLFIASMIFIIGYVFGGFSTNTTLKAITKVAAILIIVLFIAVNVFSFRFGTWHHRYLNRGDVCRYEQNDSTHHR